jgi:hypothetical protein
MVTIVAALLFLLFWGGFFFREWVFYHRPNRRIPDGDGEIYYFDIRLALDEWLYDHKWSRHGPE